MSEPLPQGLRKRGLVEVRDNVATGQTVRAPHQLFTLLFREELIENVLQAPPEADPAKADQGARKCK